MNPINEYVSYKNPSMSKAIIYDMALHSLHLHTKTIEIFCVMKGNYTIYDAGVPYELCEDDVYVFNPGCPHSIKRISDEGMVLSLHIDIDHYKTFYPELSEKTYFITYSSNKEQTQLNEFLRLRFLIAQIYLEYLTEDNGTLKQEVLTKELIALLYNEFHDYIYEKVKNNNGYHVARRTKIDGNNFDLTTLIRIDEFVENNCSDKLTLSEIAQKEYLSVPYLSKLIKSGLGITFSQLLSICRCNYVEQQLLMTQKNIDQIAEEAGFANRSQLAVQFKRWYKLTPSAYRTKWRADIKASRYISTIVTIADSSIAREKINAYLYT